MHICISCKNKNCPTFFVCAFLFRLNTQFPLSAATKVFLLFTPYPVAGEQETIFFFFL